MNIGVLILAVMLAGGAVLVFFETAAAQPQQYSDTYGNTFTPATNNTQNVIINGTAPAAQFGTGALLLLAVCVVFVGAGGAVVAIRSASGNKYQSRHG